MMCPGGNETGVGITWRICCTWLLSSCFSGYLRDAGWWPTLLPLSGVTFAQILTDFGKNVIMLSVNSSHTLVSVVKSGESTGNEA